jgi:hypothetical protein
LLLSFLQKEREEGNQRGELMYICLAVVLFYVLIIVSTPFFLVGGFLILKKNKP